LAEFIHKGGKRWRVRVFLGRETVGHTDSGQPIVKTRYHDKTLEFKGVKERNEYARDVERKRDAGTLCDGEMTVRAYLERWLETKRLMLSEPNTAESYERQMKTYVYPEIGSVELARLTSWHVQGVYNKMAQAGLSARTIQYTHTILKAALKPAVGGRLIPANPCEFTERPERIQEEVLFFDEREAQRFLEAAKADRLYAAFHLALANGPRPSEYAGLLWPDFDLKAGTVKIARVLKWNEGGGGWRLREFPKTEASRRVLRLEPETVAVLHEHKKRQLAERLAAGKRYTDNGLVFSTPTGEPLAPRNVQRRNFNPVLERAGLTGKNYVPYCLRHTFATLSIAAGADPKAVSHALGHRNVNFTYNVYVHIVESMKLDAQGKLANLLFRGVK
jgi:integrase